MSQQLTKKQIAARAYYQANKERIKEQKRAKYAHKARKQRVNKVANNSISPTPKTVSSRCQVSEAKQEKRARARRIEDIELARELGISLNELHEGAV